MFDKIFTTVGKTLKIGIYAFCCIAIVWFIASWIDVVGHNATDCTYATWNLINMIWGK